MKDLSLCFKEEGDIMGAYDDEIMTALIGEDFQISFSPEYNNSSSILIPRCNSTTSLCVFSTEPPPPPPNTTFVKRPKKQNKSDKLHHQSSNATPIILNFDNKSSEPVEHVGLCNTLGTSNEMEKAVSGTKRVRPPSQTYDHIIAERRRRAKLNQSFIALSSIVPGLKKMDKATVLGDAIKYLIHLKERVKALEEETTKQTVNSVVLIRKSHLLMNDDSSSDDNDDQDNTHSHYSTNHLPEIEARFLGKNVLIKIHSENRKGLLVDILSEIEKLNLIIISNASSTFGTLALDLTIITLMDEEFDMTMEDFVRTLRSHVHRHIQTSKTSCLIDEKVEILN